MGILSSCAFLVITLIVMVSSSRNSFSLEFVIIPGNLETISDWCLAQLVWVPSNVCVYWLLLELFYSIMQWMIICITFGLFDSLENCLATTKAQLLREDFWS